MGRTRTMERRKEREQQKKRQRQITFLVGGVLVAVVAIVLLVLINQPAEAPIPEASLTRYESIPQSKTEEGFPVLGSDAAPVKVVEYASFDCPHCADFHDLAWPGVVDRIRNGEVQFTYVPYWGTGGIANGKGAALAAVCAGEQGAFWPFHDALFEWQVTYVNTAFSQNRFAGGVSNLNLDKAQWDSCMGSTLPESVVTAAENAFRLQNATGTPALFVNGSIVPEASASALNQAIDAALAQSSVIPTPLTEVTPEVTAAESTPEATSEAVEQAEATAESTPSQ